jgi:hypothetical protein
MEPYIRNIEIIDDKMVEVLKSKTGYQRLQIAFSMWASAKIMIENYLRSMHPNWDEKSINKEVIKRLSHGII